MQKSVASVAAVLGAGVSIVGIERWVQSAIDAQDQISKLSQKVGVSTESLSGWQLAAKQAGVENEALQKGLVKLAQSADAVTQGSKTQVDAFKAIGVSVLDSSGHLKAMDSLFVDVTDGLSKMADGTKKTAIATQLFGRAGADLIPMLNAGTRGLKEYADMADAFGLTVGGASAKAAESFNDSMEQLSFVGKGLANVIVTELAPALAELAAKAVDVFKGKAWHDWMDSVGRAASFVADHIEEIVTIFKVAGEVIASIYVGKLIRSGAAWIVSLGAQAVAIVQTAAISTTAMEAMAAAPMKLIGIFGGLPAVLTQAAIATAYLMFKQTDAEKAASDLADTTDRLARAQGDVSAYAIKQAQAQLEEKKATLAQAKAHLAAIESTRGYVAGAQHMDSMAIAASNASRGVEELEVSFKSLSKQVQSSIIAKAFQDQLNLISRGTQQDADNFDALRKSLKDQNGQLAESVATFGKGKAAVLEYKESLDIAAAAADGDNNVSKQRIATIKALYEPNIALARQLDTLTESQKAHTASMQDSKKAAEDEVKRVDGIAAAYAKLADLNAGADGKNTDPVSKAWADSEVRMRAVAAAGSDLIKLGVDQAAVNDVVTDSLGRQTGARERALVAASKEMDTTGQLIQQLQQEAAMAGMSERNQFITRNGIQAETAYRDKNVNATEAQIAAQRRLVEAAAANSYDLTKLAEQQNATAQEYASYWENAAGSIAKSFGDLFTGQIRSFKDFGQSLKSIAQQFVSDMISTFLRMRVIGPIMSGVMGYLGQSGGSGSVLSLVSQYYGSGSVLSGSASSTGGATGGAGGSNSYAGLLSNISTMKSMYSYLVGGGSYATGAGNVASVGVGANGQAVAFNPYATSGYAGPYGGATSAAYGSIPYASIGGGLIGAYYGSKQGAGGFSTGLSTVSYGAAGAALAGTAAGVAGGASIGTAATGAFGAAAASTSWVPIVGWILAAAAIVDHFTGGKVFGTKFQTNQANLDLSVGPNGSDASATLDQWKYHTGVIPNFMGALTGGWSEAAKFGSKNYRQVQEAVTPEMLKAAQQLYDSLEKAMVSGAQRLGVKVPEMIEASITAQTKYDKKGKSTGTSYLVEYLGQTWKEATADLAAERLGADALISVVAKSIGSAAQSIAEQFQSSADLLLDGANTMIEAQADINKGNHLLALGATATLATVIAFTQSMQQDGEKLADTYARLVQASAAYLQFVGQFAPASTSFGASLEAIAKQMQANIDQANALAQAAGLQHAKESDLANIHQVAAKAAADAIAQLSSAAQDLAAKLYDVTGSSLAAVNTLLDKMSAKVQTAAQLAIGDNSPLSEKEKLDVALKGLRSGVTSADDVLSIGRKLYASSADYAGLFAKVQSILQLPGAGETGTTGINKALDDYNKLIGQRDQYQTQADATARFADAKTLAQYVADISTTHGIGYGEAASGLGFSLSDLAKDLGVTNLTGYLDSLKLAEIPGSTMDASASIVDAIQQLGRDLIQTITGGPLVTPGPTHGVPAAPSDPQQIALLESINQRLANLEAPISQTASTNAQMVKQGVTGDLRNVQGSNRKSVSVAL